MRVKLMTALVLSGLIALAGSHAGAAQITFTGSIPLSTTNWSDCLSIPKFNPALGTLTGVSYEFDGHIRGSAAFESTNSAPVTVTMNLQALITLFRPDSTFLDSVLPVVHTSDSATAYDGVLDFSGTSGKTYGSLSADASDAGYVPLSNLPLFTGTGNVLMAVTAVGMSFGSGSGNLELQLRTRASADVTVTYDYAPIPEPTSLLLVGTGFLSAVGLLIRRRIK